MLKTVDIFLDLDEYTYLKNCYQFVTFAYLWYEIFTRMTEKHTLSFWMPRADFTFCTEWMRNSSHFTLFLIWHSGSSSAEYCRYRCNDHISVFFFSLKLFIRLIGQWGQTWRPIIRCTRSHKRLVIFENNLFFDFQKGRISNASFSRFA